ncbi:uncharacterized protein LOC113472287, partial [Diaphorina citri]|uniref:Uncharacterized protein LOC113472287 n=1 Tax=Diaphorina citri TaxID=121845 RepID=A0A3Q0JLP8_DIACI
FSTITTSSTPLTKRKRDTVKEEDGHSSSSDFENLRRTKIKSSDKVQETKEKSNEDRLSGESGGSQGKNNTIFISSASGENSQLNFSQLDTQLKLLTDIDDLGGGEAGEPVGETAGALLAGGQRTMCIAECMYVCVCMPVCASVAVLASPLSSSLST